MHLEAEGDVFKHREREGVRPLKDHADFLPERQQIRGGGKDLLAVDPDLPNGSDSVDQVVHSIEHPQQRALAAAARADQGGHLFFGNPQVDVDQRLEVSIVEAQVFRFDAGCVHVSRISP